MKSTDLTAEEREAAKATNLAIRSALENIVFDGKSWLDMYQEWIADEHNSLKGIFYNIDPSNLDVAGDSMDFDYSDPDCPVLADTTGMSLFMCIGFREHEKSTLSKVFSEKNPETRVKLIKEYFSFIDSSMKARGVNEVVLLMNGEAERQSVFYSAYRYYDSYVLFDCFRQVLRKETEESIYLQYTLWRITQDKQYLKKLIVQIKNYLACYFSCYGDPKLDFSRPIDGLPINRKLEIIANWVEYIVFDTEQIFKAYQAKNWLVAADRLMDDYHTPNQISKSTLLGFKSKRPDDDDKTVLNKATCGLSYIRWVKTADIITILCDLFRILHHYSEQELKRMGLSKQSVLMHYDNLCKLKNHYTSFIFKHGALYEASREMFDPSRLSAEEESAQIITASVDDFLDVTNRIVDDDIAGLMSAKQRYVARISAYITEDYQEQLEDYMATVIEKMKKKISKLESFDTIFSAVSDDFLPFAKLWVRHKEILYSLVSAEYLYGEYIKGHEEIDRFDYSCVSILYYMALEDFANKLIYIPYLNNVLTPNAEDVIRNKASGYVTELKHYVRNWKQCQFKGTIELGPMGYFLAGIDDENHLQDFLRSSFPNIDIQKIKQFGQTLIGIKDRRNNAAHGGNIITYQVAKEDKENVYFSNEAEEIRGLIKSLLEMLA